MIQLTHRDYRDQRLFAKLMAASEMEPEDFVDTFGYLMGIMSELSI